MPKPSELVAKLENKISEKLEKSFDRVRAKLTKHIPLIIVGWYFYGMFINSVRLGIDSTFGYAEVASIWIANPFKNYLAVFTPTGFAISAVSIILYCLYTKKGYDWLTGNKYTHDSRGFDILPDATHGSSGFMSPKEMQAVLELDAVEKIDGTVIGKYKEKTGDDDKYDKYICIKKGSGLNDHSIIFGATGSGKSRGYVTPFILQAVKRKESIILVDPKGVRPDRV